MTVRALFAHGGLERGGAERVLRSLLRALDRSRVEPVVAFAGDGPFYEEIEALGIEIVRVPAPARLRQIHQTPHMVAALRRAVERSGADVVVANGEKMAVYTGWAARRASRPCVHWLHDAPGTGAGPWSATAAMAATPRAAAIVPSRWMADAFRRRFRLRAAVVENGIDLAELDEAERAATDVRAESGWPGDAVVAAHVGRLQRWKGADVFLRAAARTAQAHDCLRYLVVGGALFGREAGYAASLPSTASALGLNGEVRFTGHRLDATALMAASDIVVHCSTRPEPFGLVVAEGMALGKAVIATRTGGPEEMIEHRRTGLLVPPGDHAALAAALGELGERALGQRIFHAAAGDDQRASCSLDGRSRGAQLLAI
ncbi:MAG: glycosyltransferase, partial [Vicinamibacteria bacterium]